MNIGDRARIKIKRLTCDLVPEDAYLMGTVSHIDTYAFTVKYDEPQDGDEYRVFPSHSIGDSVQIARNEEVTAPGTMPGIIEGRIIHYVAYNGRHLAGIIIGCDASRSYSDVDMVIFTNMSNVNGVKNFGMQFHADIAYSESPVPGTWHWPEKA